MYREGYEYYRTPRGEHKNAQNKFVLSAAPAIVGYDSFERVLDDCASASAYDCRIAVADTKYFSERAIEAASEPKELFIVGATPPRLV
jgi:hypothetical protein